MKQSLSVVLVVAMALGSLLQVHAKEQSTRVVQYLYDGDGVKKKVSITAFGDGPAIATFSVASNAEKKEITGEISSEDFEKIWSGFSSIADLKRSDITSSKATVDTDTHHVIFTLEKSSTGTTNRSYGVLAKNAGVDFKAWLRLLEPRVKKG